MKTARQAQSWRTFPAKLHQEIKRLRKLGASPDDIHRFLVIEGRPDSSGVIRFSLSLNNLGRLILKGADRG